MILERPKYINYAFKIAKPKVKRLKWGTLGTKASINCQFCGEPATKMRFKPNKDYPMAYDLCGSCAEKHNKEEQKLI